MRTTLRTTLFAIMFGALVAAYAEPPEKAASEKAADWRVVDRAVADPEFFELAITDPELAAVVAVARISMPISDDPKDRDWLRSLHRYVGPPPPKDIDWVGGNPWETLPPPRPVLPPGHIGNRFRLMKPDDPMQQKAAELLQDLQMPKRREALFEPILEGRIPAGWQFDIHEAKTSAGVTTVRVQVYPILYNEMTGTDYVGSVVNETYEIARGKSKLVKFEPLGSHFTKR